MTPPKEEAQQVVERLQRAINAHDLEGLVACFGADVESEQPAHPARRFRGSEQVRQNWTEILRGVPDLHATLVGLTTDDRRAWAEWQWKGTRVDRMPFEMRGVTILEIREGHIAGVRFFMEPVDRGGPGIIAAVAQVVSGP